MNAIDRLPDTQRQLVEKVLYVLSRTKGLDYYRLFKVLYFAEREYLRSYFRKLVEDDFCALQYGPVPSALYNAIKARGKGTLLSQALWEVVKNADDEAEYILLPLRDADMDYIADAEASTLDKAIGEFSALSFNELVQLSHDTAWKATALSGTMDSEAIAREGGIQEGNIDYLRELLHWQLIERRVANAY